MTMLDGNGRTTEATEPIDDTDADNLAQVRELYDQVDPIPEGLTEQIKFALALEHMDAEVAKLVDQEAAAVRSPVDAAEQARTIIFEASTLTVMVTVSQSRDEQVRVDGWVSPEGPYRVELRTPEVQYPTEADALGRFVIEQMPRGVFRMVIRPLEPGIELGSPPVVITPSVILD